MRPAPLAVLLLAAAPALAQTADGSATPAAKPERKICRRLDTTGSITSGRVECHSRADWATIDGANAADAARVRNSDGLNNGPSAHR